MSIMDKESETLLKAACCAARKSSYCPYSNFRVGAALLFEDGSIIQGANVENASYGAGICAERTAIVMARMQGKNAIRAIAVTSDSNELVSPCGICRQVIREFAKLTTPIYMFTNNGNVVIRTLDDLLPFSFGPEHLIEKGSRTATTDV